MVCASLGRVELRLGRRRPCAEHLTIGPWPIRSLELSLPGPFVPWNFCSRAFSLSGTFAPGPFRSLELLFPGLFVLWNFRSRALSLPGTFAPRSELALELSVPGTFVLNSRM